MSVTRRDFLAAGGAMILGGCHLSNLTRRGDHMYGIIGRARAVPGQREALVRILLRGSRDMPGCLSYVVATDPDDPQGIWITEVWQDRESHEQSLALPQVREAIASGRPLIEEFGERFETEPVGGWGLPGSGRD